MNVLRLKPDVSLADDESLLSWSNRMARIHTGNGVLPFMRDIGVKAQGIVDGRMESLVKLSKITGQEIDALRNRTIVKTGARNRAFRGEEFTSEFAKEVGTSYCPACLLDDEANPLHPFAPRVGRMMWAFDVYRTCPIHNLPMSYIRYQIWSDRMRDLEVVATSCELKAQVKHQDARSVSPLQNYIQKRFEGQKGPIWLDAQGVDQGVRTTEVLGAISMGNVNPNIKSFSASDWDHVGRIGYEITSNGYNAIYQFLSDILKKAPKSKGGPKPQETFGFLYKWLAYDRSSKDHGPIKKLLFDFIEQEMAVPEGSAVLGYKIENRTKHTVGSLSKKFNLHPVTLVRLLKMKGLISPVSDGKRQVHNSFDAEEGEEVAAALSRAVSIKSMPEYINATRAQAEMLVKHGFINPLHRGKTPVDPKFMKVDKVEIDLFLDKLLSTAVVVDRVSSGMVRIPKAAEISSIKTPKIMHLLFQEKLKKVQKSRSERGYLGVYICPVELRTRSDC